MEALFVGIIAFGILEEVYFFRFNLPKQARAAEAAALNDACYAAVLALVPIFGTVLNSIVTISWVTWCTCRAIEVRFGDGAAASVYYLFARWTDGKLHLVIDGPAHQFALERVFKSAVQEHIIMQRRLETKVLT